MRSVRAVALAILGCACTSDRQATPTGPERSSAALSCTPPRVTPAFRLRDNFPGVSFDRPTAVQRVGEIYFVVEQRGTIYRVAHDGEGWSKDLFVDLGSRLWSDKGDNGLVGFALSPDFSASGESFVYYTGKSDHAMFRTVLARLQSTDGGRTADPATEETLLDFDHDYDGHSGGHLEFGPDRDLYIGLGDGSWGDPKLRAQNPNELFGKIARLDVLHGRPYTSPADNPFAGGGGRPEIYALGLRNPWSFSFDDSGQLWVGDVGQDRWEEIDLVVKGGNYGWPLREGLHCFQSHAPCELAPRVEPVHEYPHIDGLSVIGGRVYRGAHPSLADSYVFGDFITGRMWALDRRTPSASRFVLDSGINISGFSEDAAGELLVIDYAGHVLRLDAAEPQVQVGASLAQLGCVDPEGKGQIAPGLVPYEVNAPFWSDGLDKRRWVGLPAQTNVHVGDDGALDLPVGTIFLKELSSAGRKIETRMMVRDADAGWLGYTFEWNAQQSDAVLLEDAKTIDVGGSPWTLPSRAQCFACHRATPGPGGSNRILGFELDQLNRQVPDGIGTANQLDVFARSGVFDRPVAPATTPSLADPYDMAQPTELRARAWLHTNCSFCHRGTSLGQASIDLRASVPAEKMNIVCHDGGDDGDVGPTSLFVPGAPADSEIVKRIGGTGDVRMPPLGTARIDAAGVDLISSWIASFGSCLL